MIFHVVKDTLSVNNKDCSAGSGTLLLSSLKEFAYDIQNSYWSPQVFRFQVSCVELVSVSTLWESYQEEMGFEFSSFLDF